MSNDVKPITVKKLNNKLPLILNNKIIWKTDKLPFKGNVKVVKSLAFQEDVLFESPTGDFLCGDVRVLSVKNILNKTTNSCRTTVKCKSQSGKVFVKNSDEITKLIGQNNYDTLFSTLCSVINQDLKIRGIVSLLTVPRFTKTVSCQSDPYINIDRPITKEMQCQTDESRLTSFKSAKVRRRARRVQPAPYVIREIKEPVTKKPKRVIISPTNFNQILKEKESQENTSLPDLGLVFDEESNNSDGKYSNFSLNTTSDLLMNPMSIIANVDRVTRDTTGSKKETGYNKETGYDKKETGYNIHNLDSSMELSSSGKALPLHQVLKSIPPEQRVKALLNQAMNDWKNCLNSDESGHMPIHIAVLNNDLDLLKRQCLVLKTRDISVDIPADNLTPLKMSLYQDNVQLTAVLLQHNADPFVSDDHDRNCFHIAAEMPTEHLQILVNYCQHNARKILEDDEELWKPEYANKTDKELGKILMAHINNLYNSQGYTALMLAAKVGRYENVRVLVESSPESINTKMPSSGNTALYLAVGAACMDSKERGNKSLVVDHFKETLDILVKNGADPTIDNFAGSNVNDLLTEYNNGALSMLIANKLTCRNFWDGKMPPGTNKSDAFMLVKDKHGNVEIKKIEKNKRSAKLPKSTKSETLSGKSISPVTAKVSSKVNIVNNIPVQNFRLNKPLLLKPVATNNKRQIEITVERSSKKTNTND